MAARYCHENRGQPRSSAIGVTVTLVDRITGLWYLVLETLSIRYLQYLILHSILSTI